MVCIPLIFLFMAVTQETKRDYSVPELGAFQSAKVDGFFNAVGVEISGLANLKEAGWISEVEGQLGSVGSRLTLAEKKHLENYGWCRLIVFDVKEHPDLPSQRVIEMQSHLVKPLNRFMSTNLVKPFTTLSVRFSPVDSVSVVSREQNKESVAELSGPVPTFYEHLIVAENQFSTYELEFSPQKTID